MTQKRSIRYRLYSVFVFFMFLVFGFGIFSIDRLSDFNAVSADVRDRWLPSTRFLGDLNNYTSDFRAAEGGRLIASNASEIVANATEVHDLDRQILLAQRAYERVRHDRTEVRLYSQFKQDWSEYRRIADRVFALSAEGRTAEADTAYMTTSRTAYNTASDTLGELTDRNVASARNANERADSAYRQAVSLTSLAVIFAALMVAAAVFYIRRSISDPLLDLAHCMRLVAANAPDIEIRGTERLDEVGEMARAVVVFRNNAVDLAISQRGLAQQAAMFREKLEQEQRLTLLQRNFVSMASHEFRTPLTIIDGHAQRLIAVRHRLEPDEILERAGKIRGAVLRMASLIGGLLESSLLDAKVELYFHPEEFDLSALLHDVARLHREISPRSQIYLKQASVPLTVMGDQKLLFQVFSNLLSNAIKYSPDGGLIKIGAVIDEGTVAIIVEDNGVGVPKDDLPRLFERYYRGSNVSGIVGTGIGLYFVNMVTEIHGGTIAVESAEGTGSRFILTLPTCRSGKDAASRPTVAVSLPKTSSGRGSSITMMQPAENGAGLNDAVNLDGAGIR
jgi:two-component system OmpR family sensor kinase